MLYLCQENVIYMKWKIYEAKCMQNNLIMQQHPCLSPSIFQSQRWLYISHNKKDKLLCSCWNWNHKHSRLEKKLKEENLFFKVWMLVDRLVPKYQTLAQSKRRHDWEERMSHSAARAGVWHCAAPSIPRCSAAITRRRKRAQLCLHDIIQSLQKKQPKL